MKNLTLILAAFLMIGNSITAQTVSDEVTLIQSAFGMEKEALVREAMQLSGDKSEAFWNVYRAYENERRAAARERLQIINEYLENYDTMTDAKAEDLARRTIAADAALSKLHRKYFAQFKKATSATDAAKFLQLDRHIHATIRLILSDNLPFLVEK